MSQQSIIKGKPPMKGNLRARTAVPDSKTSVGTMASYGMGKYLSEFFSGAFGALVFKFYETEIGLPASYAAIGIILYSIWNAVNDPLIGYLTFRPTPLASRLGRRFPWIASGPSCGSSRSWQYSLCPPVSMQHCDLCRYSSGWWSAPAFLIRSIPSGK
jgi:hypothetical protein